MKKRLVGFWGTAHWSLDLVGRSASWFFPTKSLSSENDAYSVIGGAVVGAIFGGSLGFAWSEEGRAMTNLAGAAIGGLLGICTGVMFGAIVQTIDDAIDDWLNSLNSK
jgi:hypothetical protein